jgi:hypothetical protein
MKILAAILLLTFCFTACGKIENFTNLAQQKIETEPAENEQPDVPPILEITQDTQGMWDAPGKTLFLNLYENGVIEFEYEDKKKLVKGKTNRAEEVNTLQRAKISKEKLQEFLDLLNSEEFQNTQNDYTRKCCCTDATVDYKIHFQSGGKQKNVSLNGYCGLGEFINGRAPRIPNFPNILYSLMFLIDDTRQKYIPDESSNQPR